MEDAASTSFLISRIYHPSHLALRNEQQSIGMRHPVCLSLSLPLTHHTHSITEVVPPEEPTLSHVLMFTPPAAGDKHHRRGHHHHHHAAKRMLNPQLAQVTGLSSYGRYMGYCWNRKLMVITDEEGNVRLWKLPRFQPYASLTTNAGTTVLPLVDFLSSPDSSASLSINGGPTPVNLLDSLLDGSPAPAENGAAASASVSTTLVSSRSSPPPHLSSGDEGRSDSPALSESFDSPQTIDLWSQGKFSQGWSEQRNDIATVTASYILASAMVMVRGYSDGKVPTLSLDLSPSCARRKRSSGGSLQMSIHKIPSDPSPRFIRGHRGSRVNTLFCSVSHGTLPLDSRAIAWLLTVPFRARKTFRASSCREARIARFAYGSSIPAKSSIPGVSTRTASPSCCRCPRLLTAQASRCSCPSPRTCQLDCSHCRLCIACKCTSIKFMPSLDSLASASIHSFTHSFRFPGHPAPITEVRLRLDQDYLLVQCEDTSVSVWEMSTGQLEGCIWYYSYHTYLHRQACAIQIQLTRGGLLSVQRQGGSRDHRDCCRLDELAIAVSQDHP